MSDDQLRAVDKLKVVELKAQLAQFGLSTSGLKADLAQRLKNHLISQVDNEPSEGSDETVEDSPKAPEAADSSPSSGDAPGEDTAHEQGLPVDSKDDPPSPGEPEPPADSEKSSSTSNDENSNEPMEPEPMDVDSQPSYDDPSSRDEVQPPPVDEETVDSPPREAVSGYMQGDSQSSMPRDEDSSDQQVSHSPDQQVSQSPDQQVSRSPDQQVSQSPDRQASQSPDQRVSQSPAQQVSQSPERQDSRSPDRGTSRSPDPQESGSPPQEASRSTYHEASQSSYPEASRSPYQDASRSPERDESQGSARAAADSRSSESGSPPMRGNRAESDKSNDATTEDDSRSKGCSMDDVIRKNLDLLEKAEKHAAKAKADAKVQQILNEKGINLPTKQPGETKNQKKKRRKKTRKIMKNLNKDAGSDGESARDSERATDVEIEYVPDQVDRDISWFQFSKVFEKFRFEEAEGKEKIEPKPEVPQVTDRLLERKKPADLSEDEDDEDKKDDGTTPKLSKKKLKQLTRMSVAELKIKVHHPELVEMHDVTAKDPVFLLTLKATRNSVPVPRHWCFKRKYLQGKRGIEKPPFDLPGFIKRTGICEMRAALQEKEEAKTLKSKQREKIRPKMGKIDIDYQKLHDAFFKWQTKPKLAMHGDLYYEGKEFETRLKEKKPGDLSDDLRTALGMPTGPNAAKCPPPWLIAMQRYGPPPSYPNLKIPGLNAPIPEGCSFGYHAGGWGKPPVDETGKPLYGDVFGLTAQESGVSQVEQDIDKLYVFGAMEEEESDEESEEEDEEEEESDAEEPDETGLVTPAEGLATPSGLQSSVSQAPEISDSIELRKRKIEADMEMGDQLPQLYTVLHEKKQDRIGHAMMGSVHTYDIPGQPAANKKGVELALDPSELEMDPGAMAARYEQTVREQQSQLAKEDFSDMVAEHAAKQKNKRKAREEAGAGGKKKYKEFKF